MSKFQDFVEHFQAAEPWVPSGYSTTSQAPINDGEVAHQAPTDFQPVSDPPVRNQDGEQERSHKDDGEGAPHANGRKQTGATLTKQTPALPHNFRSRPQPCICLCALPCASSSATWKMEDGVDSALQDVENLNFGINHSALQYTVDLFLQRIVILQSRYCWLLSCRFVLDSSLRTLCVSCCLLEAFF